MNQYNENEIDEFFAFNEVYTLLDTFSDKLDLYFKELEDVFINNEFTDCNNTNKNNNVINE